AFGRHISSDATFSDARSLEARIHSRVVSRSRCAPPGFPWEIKVRVQAHPSVFSGWFRRATLAGHHPLPEGEFIAADGREQLLFRPAAPIATDDGWVLRSHRPEVLWDQWTSVSSGRSAQPRGRPSSPRERSGRRRGGGWPGTTSNRSPGR